MAVKKRQPLRETNLYAPVHDYLVAQGYTVRSEVLHCDVAAVKDGELVVVELKTTLTLGLLVQALRRQRAADTVYVALPHPASVKWAMAWKDTELLLRRLELGLLLVDVHAKKPSVEIAFHPEYRERRKYKAKKRAILREMAGRSADLNQGGSTRRKIMTAYRESAIQIACYLDFLGPSSAKQLRELGACKKTNSILYQNVYGWFERTERGVYGLLDEGRKELGDFPQLVDVFRERLEQVRRE